MDLRRRFLRAACLLTALGGLVACSAPPTDVVDLRLAPPATLDAMLHVPILPLGEPPPPAVGSVGQIMGYGCGVTTSAAASLAAQQLQAKALRMRAVAVMDVIVAPADTGACYGGYGATASGIALAERGIPSTW